MHKKLVHVVIDHKHRYALDFTGRMLYPPVRGMCKYYGNSEKGWIEKAWNDRDKTMYAHQITGEMIKLNAGKK